MVQQTKHQKKLQEISEKYKAAADATPEQINKLKEQEWLATFQYYGYAGLLWTIEILFLSDLETKRHLIKDQTSEQIMKVRKNIFSVGLMVQTDHEVWQIVSPYNIKTVFLTKQSKYFGI